MASERFISGLTRTWPPARFIIDYVDYEDAKDPRRLATPTVPFGATRAVRLSVRDLPHLWTARAAAATRATSTARIST